MIRHAGLALALVLTPAAAMAQSLSPPLVIAHRGASGERPEHTRAAYRLAIDQGADVIEPDLVMTRDGVLVVRHENEIGGTTDVAAHPEFADRRRTARIDGETVTGWFTENFTLAELRTLRARERLPDLRPASAAFDGQEPILTFEEVIALAREASAETGRTIGVAPELKHPSHFAAVGLPMEDAFVEVLTRWDLTGAEAPILIQCFEVGTLERLSRRIDAPLLQLIAASGGPADRSDLDYAAMMRPDGLARIAGYARWIGVDARLAVDVDGRPTGLIDQAHAAGLRVAAWTFRAENVFLPAHRRGPGAEADPGDLQGWIGDHLEAGLDAVFSDFPAVAVQARDDRAVTRP